jgi:hypothetical protein
MKEKDLNTAHSAEDANNRDAAYVQAEEDAALKRRANEKLEKTGKAKMPC